MRNIFKKFIFILFAFYFMTGSQQVFASALPKPPNNLGLLGYWSMEDCRSDKATDFSGNGNVGTLTNFALSGATSNWITGKRGCALNFDGTNDYVDAGTGSSITSATNITVSAWVKPNLLSDQRYVSQWSTNTSLHFVLLSGISSGKFQFYVSPDGSAYTSSGAGTTTIVPGTWYHVVGTYDGTSIKIYVNGVEENSGALSGALFDASTNPILIGQDNGGNGKVSGSIDDVRIYNRALGQTEITQLYGYGSAKIFGAGSDKSAGLIGHWKLDDRSGTSATDSAGTATGTLTNFALSGLTSNWVAGYRGGGLNFDATDDHIVLPSASGFASTQDHSFATWVYPTSLAGTYIWLVDYGGGSGTNGSSLIIYSATDVPAFFYNGGSSFVLGTQTIPLNQWTHIIASYSSSTNKVTFYVNGTLDTETATLGAWSTSTSAHYIGRWFNGAYSFLGSMDDVRVYNTALTATEAKNLYSSGTARPTIINSTSSRIQGSNLASGLVGHWTFDGSKLSTTTATDSSTSSNNGTLTNGPTPALGKLGQALSFDGVNDHVSIPTLSIPSTITVSSWVYSTNFNQAAMIVLKKPVNTQWQLYLENTIPGSNGIKWRGNSNTDPNGASNIYPSDNQWHHLVATQAGTTVVIYLDGVSIYTNTSVSLIGNGTTATTNDILISTYDGTNYPFNGKIDDVRIYNRALTAAEVLQLYNLGR